MTPAIKILIISALALLLAPLGCKSKDTPESGGKTAEGTGSTSEGGSGGGEATLNGSGSTFQKTYQEAAIEALDRKSVV